MSTPFSVLVLAAGQGTRMKSTLPKVLHPVAGRPMLEHVLTAVQRLKPARTAVVLGVGRQEVRSVLEKHSWKDLHYVVQATARGSGHAVMRARSWLRKLKGHLLIVYGDTPLLTSETLRELVDHHRRSRQAATFLTMDVADPTGYGRMVLNGQGFVERIVEHKDATGDEKRITLVNSGVACWDIALLLKVLSRIRPNNAKREYYLTDAASLLVAAGERVGVWTVLDAGETQGINNRVDLAQAEAICRQRILQHWMREGVTMVDPATTYIDAEATLAPDTRLWPSTMIRGASKIGSHCEIGPFTLIEGATVQDGARVGPYARLRPGTLVEKNVHVGNFVEIKKSRVREGSKVNHLTYIGDSLIGRGVNIGAGTITCNYDGYSKHATRIDDDVFVGSNTNLVAPVHVGRGAIIAAGSTITENVPPGALSLARARQVNKPRRAEAFRKNAKRAHHD